MRKPRRSAAKVVTILALGLAGFALAGIGAGVGLATDSTTGTTGTTGTTTAPPTTTTTPPEEGCTLTPGYWKTHADPTRKQFDATWSLLPQGPQTIFFLSGQSYIDVLNQDKSTGHAYYILAFQWIAAQLNQLAGASISGAAAAAFADGEDLFNTYTPAQIGALSGDDPLRQQFISAAATLDDYNNGVIGPGHCGD